MKSVLGVKPITAAQNKANFAVQFNQRSVKLEFFSKMARKYTCLLTKELAVFLLLGLYSASVVHGAGKVLVLVDNINTQDTHSIFLNSLKGIKYSCLYIVIFCNLYTLRVYMYAFVTVT